MQISTKFTIAAHLLIAVHYYVGEQKMTSDCLAESIGCNPVIVRNIMCQLKEAGMLETKRGPGGIKPTMDLDQITFWDLYKLLEKDCEEGMFRFQSNPGCDCLVGKNMHDALGEALDEVQSDFVADLKRRTLADVYKRLIAKIDAQKSSEQKSSEQKSSEQMKTGEECSDEACDGSKKTAADGGAMNAAARDESAKPAPKRVIRTAVLADLEAVSAVEQECFPPAEAATPESFAERLKYYGNHFWLMFEDGKLISFVDGFVTDEPDLTDEMYEDATMHNEDGAWQMIFGVNTIPSRRREGLAGTLIKRAIADAREQGRKGLVLTCKREKIGWYASFGFVNEGLSESVHGNVEWYQMRLTF